MEACGLIFSPLHQKFDFFKELLVRLLFKKMFGYIIWRLNLKSLFIMYEKE